MSSSYFYVNAVILFLASLILGIIGIPLLKKSALKLGILVSKEVPLAGGIGIGLSFLCACLLGFFVYKGLWQETAGVIIPALMMLFFGLVDDWRELSVIAKLLAQIAAATLLILFGVRTHIVYIGDTLNIIITYIWVLGITNAFNHLDVMDGVTGGCALIITFTFFIVSISGGDIRTAILCCALAGSILSFLIYNFPPAKIYMGNCGSHFLGFILAAISLIISYASLEKKIALLSPVLILGFPVYDTVFLILTRISKKMLPFKKSNDHLVLRFLFLGHSKKKALLIMLSLCFFFSSCGALLSKVGGGIGVSIVIFVILASLVLTSKMFRVKTDG